MKEFEIDGLKYVPVKMVPVKVQGMRHEGREAILDEVLPGSIVELRREPENPHDPHAVAVYAGGKQAGYAPRALSRLVARALDAYGKPVYGAVLETVRHPVPYITFNVLKPKE